MAMPSCRGRFVGRIVGSTLTPQIATKMPSTPPAEESTRDSARNCRMRRPRPAPRAARTASSLRRADVRVNSNPATFAQATSRSRPTAPKSVKKAVRTSPTMASAKGATAASVRLTFSPYWFLIRRAIESRSARACSTVTRSRRRPRHEGPWAVRLKDMP